MSENTKLEYGCKQMMLCSTNWHGGIRMHFPYVLLKGYWFLFWGFNPGDQVTLIGLAKGVIVMQVTKTRDQYEEEGWPKKKHDGLSYGQLLTIADDLLKNTQVFCQYVVDRTR